MAVHHLTPADFRPEMPSATPGHMRAAIAHDETPDVLVAHNCAFERKFLGSDVTGASRWICTYKVAMHVWPDARYWRGLAFDPVLAMPPHRAGPDSWVTAHLLLELLRFTTVEQMIAWSDQPRPLPKLPFGKHRGTTWSEVPADYLQWMLSQDMDTDVLWHGRAELGRR